VLAHGVVRLWVGLRVRWRGMHWAAPYIQTLRNLN